MCKNLKNDLLLRALRGEKTLYTPVWFMRQAGRYLPEYRALRERAGTFMGLCQDPDGAAEATLQPLQRYPLDAVIFFSDILTVPDAMGLGLHFEEQRGPIFERPIRTEKDVDTLRVPDMELLDYVFEGIRRSKQLLNGAVPLIGFCGSPFTIACYMVQGEGSKSFHRLRQMMYEAPELLHRVLKVCTDALLPYLAEQVRAGVDVLQIFDTWGGLLSTPAFTTFSLQYTAELMRRLREELGAEQTPPIICFTKDATVPWYRLYQKARADAVGVDWRHELSDIANTLPHFPLQGNLDPFMLYAGEEELIRRVHEIMNRVPLSTPHIFNLGHGIDKETPTEKVALVVEEVHRYSRQMPNA